MNNLDELQKVLKEVSNPKQYLLNQVTNVNPMFSSLIDMALKGETQNVRNFARNFCRERNVDFDTTFAEFMNKR